jgi:hypothetical protein
MQRSGQVKATLFSQKNRDTLRQIVAQDVERRQGLALTEKQQDRLERTIDHYVEEVYSAQGNQPLPLLNKEVIKASASDFSKYLQRSSAVAIAPVTAVQTVMTASQASTIFQDTSQRYEIIQNERLEGKTLPPPQPDFRIALDDDGPSPATLYETAKKAREAEAIKLASLSKDANERMDPGVMIRVAADDMFRQGQQEQNKATNLVLNERRAAARPEAVALTVPPDGRELALLALNPGPRAQGDGNASSVTTIPPFISPQKSNLPQDYLIRQNNVVEYKEIENNLFVCSADRDWLKNTADNRYSFSVNFDPGNNGQGLFPQVSVQQKFKNISRIELVKAILPIEGLQTLIQKNTDLSNNTDFQVNVLSYPYVTVRIPELENNNYGSDNFIDRSFGVLQYDANWYSDPGTSPAQTDSRGYTAMIPKFLKCQKVYSPAPLSTLQRLSIDLLQPTGSVLSLTADTVDISDVRVGPGFAVQPYASGSAQAPEYFVIITNTYFSRFQMAVGDTIRVANFGYANDAGGNGTLQEFSRWLNRADGHVIADIGYYSGSLSTMNAVVPNTVGYANCILIQNQYTDPTTGSISPYRFGGPSGNIDSSLTSPPTALNTPRRLINLSRQTQLVFRVITREMDPGSGLRPDNM